MDGAEPNSGYTKLFRICFILGGGGAKFCKNFPVINVTISEYEPILFWNVFNCRLFSKALELWVVICSSFLETGLLRSDWSSGTLVP